MAAYFGGVGWTSSPTPASKSNEAEIHMVNQIMSNLQQAQSQTLRPMDERALDEFPDSPEDGMMSPVPCNTVLKDGKYAKNKLFWTVERTYLQDKNYVRWVRAHTNQDSSLEMQRLRIYIYHRDTKKKIRMEESKYKMGVQMPMTPSPAMMAHTGPPCTQVNRLPGLKEARNLPKSMKARGVPVGSEEMEVDHWSMISDAESIRKQERAVQAWNQMVGQMHSNQNIREKEMALHLSNMPPAMLSKFMMNMIYM